MKIDVISKVSDHPKFPTPLLFVHGLWVGMWGWQDVAQAVVDWIQTMDSNQVIQEKISTLK